MDLTYSLTARSVLAAVFLVSAAAKIRDRAGWRASLSGFGVWPSMLAPVAAGLPVVEVAVAVALWVPATAGWGALGALILLAVFVAAVVRVMTRGVEARCHCFGQLHASRVGWPTLARNTGLMFLAGALVAGEHGVAVPDVRGWMRGFPMITVAIAIAGTTAAMSVAAGGWFMIHLLRQHGRLLLRLDALEATLSTRGIAAATGTAAADGLPPGISAPAFQLSDLAGRLTTLGDLLGPGLPVMLVFSHPGCTPCVEMSSEIPGWQRTHETLRIAVVSHGSAGDNLATAVAHDAVTVLLQQEREVADAYQAYATPSAVLISSAGRIASPVAQGAIAIRELLRTHGVTATGGSPTANTAMVRDTSQPWRGAAPAPISATGLNAH